MQAPEEEVLPVRSDKARRRISCLVLGLTGVALLALCGLMLSCVFFGYGATGLALLPFGRNNIHLTRPTSPDTLSIYQGTATVGAVAWSPDGQRVASAQENGLVQSWNAVNAGTVMNYAGNGSAVLALAWSPDGQWLAAGESDGIVRIWNASNGQQVYVYQGHASSIARVAWSPDSQRIAALLQQTNGNTIVTIWDATTGAHAVSVSGETALVWSPNGQQIATYDGEHTVMVWNSSTGQRITSYTLHNTSGLGVDALRWTQNGQLVLASTYANYVQFWNVNTGQMHLSAQSHKEPIEALAWSPNLRYVASASQDETVDVWNASSGALLYTYPCYIGIVTSVAWSPHGKRIVSGSGSELPTLGSVKDDTVQVWRVPLP